MEREWWLMALLGFVALVGLMLLALLTLGLLDPVAEVEPSAIAPESAIEVSLDPLRASVGVGAAIVLFATALLLIKRTDWSLEEP